MSDDPEHKTLFEKIDKMVDVVHELTLTVERSIMRTEHQEQELERLEATVDRSNAKHEKSIESMGKRIEQVEIVQAGNRVRFAILAVIGTAVVGALVSLFFGVTMPIIENAITNDELTNVIKEINSKLDD